MKRFVTEKLLAWKNHERRKPLIIRGARQVGKTWSVIDFGRHHFEGSLHVVDLEQHPDWHRVFEPNPIGGKDFVRARDPHQCQDCPREGPPVSG